MHVAVIEISWSPYIISMELYLIARLEGIPTLDCCIAKWDEVAINTSC